MSMRRFMLQVTQGFCSARLVKMQRCLRQGTGNLNNVTGTGNSMMKSGTNFLNTLQNLEPKKNDPSLRVYENIRVPPWGLP